MRLAILLICLSVTFSSKAILSITTYGAVGDETNLLANTVSNSTSFTSSWVLPQSYVGETCELFGCGQWHYGLTSGGTNGYGQEDLITSIVSISGTTVSVTNTISNTLTGAYCIAGTNNSPAIQSCINAAASNDVILVPTGNYLCLSSSNKINSWYNPTNFNADSNNKQDIYYSLVITNGALTITNQGANARLVAQGAWRDVVTTVSSNGTPYYFTNVQRGALIAEMGPLGNNGPVMIAGVTLDGGVPQGFTGHSSPPGNTVDGNGWDETSDAITAIGGFSPSAGYYQMWPSTLLVNDTFQHFRGEMIKDASNATNGNTQIINCQFIDGNATGDNWQEAGIVTNCYFSNILMIAEIGQGSILSPWIFTGNLATNIQGGGLVVEVGNGNNQAPFTISNNVLWFANYFGNGAAFGFPSGENTLVISNAVHMVGYCEGIAAGYLSGQVSYQTFGIEVTGNTFWNPYIFSYTFGGTNGSDIPHIVTGLLVSNNIVIETAPSIFHQQYGWTTNVVYVGNQYPSNNLATVNPDPNGVPYTNYAYIDIGNGYWSPINDTTDSVITLSYAHGSRYIAQSVQSGAQMVLGNSDALSTPANAQCLVTNQGANTFTMFVNSTNGTAVSLSSGNSADAYFLTGGLWSFNLPLKVWNIVNFNVGTMQP